MHGAEPVINEITQLLWVATRMYFDKIFSAFSRTGDLTYNVDLVYPSGDIRIYILRSLSNHGHIGHGRNHMAILRIILAVKEDTLCLWFNGNEGMFTDCYQHKVGNAVNFPALMIVMIEHTHVFEGSDEEHLWGAIHDLTI